MAYHSVGFPTGSTPPASPLQTAASSTITILSSDNYIFGGWAIVSNTGDTNNVHALLRAGAFALFASDSNGDGSGDRLLVGFKGGSIVVSTNEFTYDVPFYVVCWGDRVAGKMYLQVNNGTVHEAVFSGGDTGTQVANCFQFVGGSLSGAILDEWFLCKNPPSLPAAVTTFQGMYNSGDGTVYAGMSGAAKTALGLVSWWGFDETSGTRFDLHGSNHFTTVDGSITMEDPIVEIVPILLELFDSITPSDAPQVESVQKKLTETATLTDTLGKAVAISLFDSTFLDDAAFLSPLLTPLNDQILLSDWISITRNPSAEEWHN